MLKFTNLDKTAATFNGAYFSLAAPEDWNSIGDGPTREAVKKWLNDGNPALPKDPPTLDEQNAPVHASLREIDFKSIRSLREYIASKADAPQILKDHETAAKAERAKLKK